MLFFGFCPSLSTKLFPWGEYFFFFNYHENSVEDYLGGIELLVEEGEGTSS